MICKITKKFPIIQEIRRFLAENVGLLKYLSEVYIPERWNEYLKTFSSL